MTPAPAAANRTPSVTTHKDDRLMSDTLTSTAYDTALLGITGEIEERRWQLAFLCLRAKRDKVPMWAEKGANVIRKAKRTVIEYAQIAEFAESLPRHYDLPISFYQRTLRFLDKLPDEVIINALEDAELNKEIIVEDYVEYLSGQANPDADNDEPPAPDEMVLPVWELNDETIKRLQESGIGAHIVVLPAWDDAFKSARVSPEKEAATV